MASKYEPNNKQTFQCLDGSAQIPYEHLNDDYCDCADGSDEPGMTWLVKSKTHNIVSKKPIVGSKSVQSQVNAVWGVMRRGWSQMKKQSHSLWNWNVLNYFVGQLLPLHLDFKYKFQERIIFLCEKKKSYHPQKWWYGVIANIESYV